MIHAADGSANVWPARVLAAAYYGSRREYLLDIGGQTLRADTPPEIVHQPGDSVTVACAADDIVLIAGEAGPGVDAPREPRAEFDGRCGNVLHDPVAEAVPPGDTSAR